MQTVTPTPHAPERFVTAAEIADLLGMTPRWVVEKAHAGHLPHYKLPGSNRVKFLVSEVLHKLKGA
jgi:excisionase family DNA binding protein